VSAASPGFADRAALTGIGEIAYVRGSGTGAVALIRPKTVGAC